VKKTLAQLSLLPVFPICALAITLLSGCAVQPYSQAADENMRGSALNGKAMGGEQPIVGATVTLYTTTSDPGDSYGSGGTLRAYSNAVTASDGSFSFNPPTYTCPSNQQAYITVSGGSSGSSTNSQILELAGIGPCGSLPAFVNVDEVTTVASAYALGNFMSIDSTGFVHISAPPNNNAATGSTTAAAGLSHAFLNIPTLVSLQSGTANTAGPNSGITGGSVGVVPAAEINTIADILYSCVNSTGSAAGAIATPISFAAPTAPSSSAGASTTLTVNNLSDLGFGTVGVSLAGTTPMTFALGSQALTTGLPALATLFKSVATITSTNTATAPTSSAVATGTISLKAPNSSVTLGGAMINIQGTLAIAYAGGAAQTHTIPAPTNTAGLAAFISANYTGVTVAGYTPTSVVITGASPGTSNTISFSGTTLTDLTGLTASASSNVLTLSGPVGTANTLAISGLFSEDTDATTCGQLFALTPSLTGAVPTNTLQAAMNLAKNPYVSASNLTAFFALLGSQTAFTPSLTAAPNDWSIAVTYPFPTFPTGETSSYPKDLALDANDTVYVANNNVASTSLSTNIYAFTSNGSNLYINNPSLAGITYVRNIATDNTGLLWATTASHLYKLTASTGALVSSVASCGSQQYGIAVDMANNVWTIGNNSTSNICELPYNTSTDIDIDFGAPSLAGGDDLEIDANQNIWVSEDLSNQVLVIPNVGTLTSPLYNTTSATGTTGTGFSTAGLDTALSMQHNPASGIAIDASGNAWATSTGVGNVNLNEITPTVTSGVLTALPPTPTSISYDTSFNTPVRLQVDGGGVAWIADTGIIGYSTTTSAFATPLGGLKPCVVSGTTCTSAVGSIKGMHIDSTGSMWLANSGSTPATAILVQVIGTANPTWPYLGTGKPGVMPR
jgi:hypothetical protein